VKWEEFVAWLLVPLVALGLLLGGLFLAGNRFVPRCSEDAVIVGAGKFEGGRWSEYVCGPATDEYAVCSVGDLNGDGRVDVLDVQLLVNKVLEQSAPVPVDPGRLVTASLP
jgi:hypothetical protein